jgi:hypothetical protein
MFSQFAVCWLDLGKQTLTRAGVKSGAAGF